jgi:hypothetical protein
MGFSGDFDVIPHSPPPAPPQMLSSAHKRETHSRLFEARPAVAILGKFIRYAVRINHLRLAAQRLLQ